jgi:hypothetical protein
MYSVVELAEKAHALSAQGFADEYGPAALLSKPSVEQLQRAALSMPHTAAASDSPQYLDELLVMLRAFRTLNAFFLRPSRAPQAFVVGRDASCDFSLDDPSVSKVHASVLWDGTSWHVLDEGSRNGTFVNAEPVSKEASPLSNGDAIAFGDFQLVFIDARTLRSQLLAMPPPRKK